MVDRSADDGRGAVVFVAKHGRHGRAELLGEFLRHRRENLLDMRTDGRLPEPIEVAAYHVVSEALTNAAKHADAPRAAVHVEVVTGAMRISVRDDGCGGAGFTAGTGLVGLKDRVEALGGRFWLHSPHGTGTTLRAELPLANADAHDWEGSRVAGLTGTTTSSLGE
jgi:signal transduction histidine kinase